MTTNTIPAAGHNAFDASAFEKAMRQHGRDSIRGEAARPAAMLDLAHAVTNGYPLEAADGSDNVAAAYKAYADGRAQAGGKLTTGADTDSSFKVQVSKFRQIAKCAALPMWDTTCDATHLFDRTITLRGKLAADPENKLKPAADALVDVARAQQNCADVLTDAEIEDIVRKPEKGEKSELDKLIDAYKRVAKLADDGIGGSHTEQAASEMATAITEMGGEVPAVTAEEKQIAKDMAAFLELQKKLGM